MMYYNYTNNVVYNIDRRELLHFCRVFDIDIPVCNNACTSMRSEDYSTWSVCVSLCVSTAILPLQAMRRPMNQQLQSYKDMDITIAAKQHAL